LLSPRGIRPVLGNLRIGKPLTLLAILLFQFAQEVAGRGIDAGRSSADSQIYTWGYV
jgi:hypothetical protein